MTVFSINEITIKISIIKASALTLTALAFLSVSVWAFCKFWILPSGFNKSFLLTGITLLIISAGFASFSGLTKLFNSKFGLILDNNGIHINMGPNRGQFIKWGEITGFKVHSPVRGPIFLLIFIKDPEEILRQVNGFRRFLLKMNKVSHKTPVSLTSNWLDCSFEELESIIKDNYKKNST